MNQICQNLYRCTDVDEASNELYLECVEDITKLMREWDTRQQAFKIIRQQIQKHTEIMDKHSQDFKSLLKPLRFINSYPSVLKEVNRRNAFNKFITEVVSKSIEDYDTVIAREQNERLRFLKLHGEVIPQDFLPELKLQP